MSGHWTGSTRRSQLPPNWAHTRTRILQRDNHQCTWTTDGQRCPNPATDIDHIQPGNNHTDTNLRALCRTHHNHKSSIEGNTQRWKHRTTRTPEQHPGLR